jgi:hypothetical protein
MAGPGPKQGVGRTTVRHRAQELKQELHRPTIKLPDNRESSYEQHVLLGRRSDYGQRRRSMFWPLCIALLLGALSMLIPVAGTFSLQGTLSSHVEPAPGTDALPALPTPEGAARRALVFAEPAECPWVQLDEPSIVTLDVPGESELVLSASILSIEAHARDASAAAKQPACRVELALLPEGDEEATLLRGLPPGTRTRADFPTTRSWVGAFVAQLPTDSQQMVNKVSAGFQSLSGWVRQLYRSYVAPRLHDTDMPSKPAPAQTP